MKIIHNENLSKHCTFKIGGNATNYFIPDTINELSETVKKYPKEFLILGGGSNLLINDEGNFPCVIDMRNCCKEFIVLENNEVYVGSSFRIQSVINTLHEYNLGGFEFLYSLPALFGGCIYMNAGRGSDGNSIGKFVKSVKYMDENGIIYTIPVSECLFSFRHSIFHAKKWIILGATLHCDNCSLEEGKQRIAERIKLCKEMQDMENPNFGSVFASFDSRIMRFVRFSSHVFPKKHGCVFSGKTINWLLNKNGSFKDAKRKINNIILLHKVFRKNCRTEVVIWE